MSARKISRHAALAMATGICLALAGCGSDSPTGPGVDPDPEDPDPGETDRGNPDGVLECEIVGYPCSLAEVDPAVLERSDALGDSVLAMLDAGAPMAEAAAWLETEADMVEVEFDDAAVRFRLEDGRGVWIFQDAAFDDEGGSGVPPAAHPVAGPLPAQVVVAEESEEKRALVLSPFLWHFGPFDDGPAVRDILAATRGYGNGVSFAANATLASSNVGVNSFKGWGQYQVVHVSSHGERLCGEAGCRAMIVAGWLPEGSGTTAEKLGALADLGVEHAKWVGYPGVVFLSLTADFFRTHYPSGLDDAVIFFNACETFGSEASDLASAIHGSTSVVFGWSQGVDSDESRATALALYEGLSERGYPAEIAYDELGDLQYGAGGTRLIIGKRTAGGDLRIREVVWVLHPATGQVLTPADRVAIEGIQGDGENDAVPYLIQVDGVKPELAGDMLVHVTIDGIAAEPVPLDEGEVDEMDRWTLSGTLPLEYDLEEEKEADFGARAELHDDGESKHGTPATLTGQEPIMGHEWELQAAHVTFWSGTPWPTSPYTATATLTLTFEEGQDPLEPRPRYIVTGGTVTFDYNHRYDTCTFTAPVLTYDVTEEHVTSPFTTRAALVFNTTSSPVTYTANIYTRGPEFQYTAMCDELNETRTHRATNVWLLAEPEDQRTVSADRKSITGTYGNEVVFNAGYKFIQESTYTINRIR